MYKIEEGIPMPEHPETGRRAKYPFADMKVGDSFAAGHGELELIRSASAYYKRVYKMKFVIRPEGDNGIRIWRSS